MSKNKQIAEVLEQEEYLCNLPLLCKLSVYESITKNEDSHIDIELRVVENWQEDSTNEAIVISEDEVRAFCNKDIYCIDTRKAVLTQRMYSLITCPPKTSITPSAMQWHSTSSNTTFYGSPSIL